LTTTAANLSRCVGAVLTDDAFVFAKAIPQSDGTVDVLTYQDASSTTPELGAMRGMTGPVAPRV
jgi:hypothetical protein